MRGPLAPRRLLLAALLGAASPGAAWGRQPVKGAMTKPGNRPGLGCGADNAAVVPALQRRARIAGFYDHFVALTDQRVIEWTLGGTGRVALDGARHVAVAKARGYAIDAADRLVSWSLGTRDQPAMLLEDVAHAAAGESGLLAIGCDGSLRRRRADGGPAAAGPLSQALREAESAIHCCIGDSSDYYIDPGGTLYASGLAHRGQYGDGKLAGAPGWTAVADRASFVVAHTGHAVYLRDDGAVLGTGGNRFGPLSSHGLGDKADRWGVIFDGAAQVATGSRHTLALRADGTLWGWGGADGVRPKRLLDGVAAIAAGSDGSAAIDVDGALWSWRVGDAPARIALPAR